MRAVRLSIAIAVSVGTLGAPGRVGAQDVVDPTPALRALRSAPAQAVGQPTSRLDHEVGDVFVMEHDGSNYDMRDGSGLPNYVPRAALARRFYETHADSYDFLIVFTNFDFSSPGAQAFHNQVRNDALGIGRPPLDLGSAFGSPGRLKGYIDMAALSRYRSGQYSLQPGDVGFSRTLGVLGHEVAHQWLSYVHVRDAQGQAVLDLLARTISTGATSSIPTHR